MKLSLGEGGGLVPSVRTLLAEADVDVDGVDDVDISVFLQTIVGEVGDGVLGEMGDIGAGEDRPRGMPGGPVSGEDGGDFAALRGYFGNCDCFRGGAIE